MPDEIVKALKRIGEGLIQVYIRNGFVWKIPAQEIKLQPKDGVQEIKIIAEDITEE